MGKLLVAILFIRHTRFFQFVELGRHGGVASCQTFNRQVLGLVVREPEVVCRFVQGIFRLLQVLDRFIDPLDRFRESIGGKPPVAPEGGLEVATDPRSW